MRKILYILGILIIGAVIFAPVISYIGLDPIPGDFTITYNNQHHTVPVIYSLCVSCELGLLYFFLIR